MAGAMANPQDGRALPAPCRTWSNALPVHAARWLGARSWPDPGRRRAVDDDGPGLAQPQRSRRAFERVYLLGRYGADRPVGTGLGLAIVAELAAAMGGRVAVASEPGAG